MRLSEGIIIAVIDAAGRLAEKVMDRSNSIKAEEALLRLEEQRLKNEELRRKLEEKK